jgi:hypothetical protein
MKGQRGVSFLGKRENADDYFGQQEDRHTGFLRRMVISPKQKLVREMAQIAERYGISLYSCCQPELVGEGVKRGSCVDYSHMASIFGELIPAPRKSPTRAGCCCYESIDIGIYDTCLHDCVYCYANQDYRRALKRYRAYRPESLSLLPGEYQFSEYKGSNRIPGLFCQPKLIP